MPWWGYVLLSIASLLLAGISVILAYFNIISIWFILLSAYPLALLYGREKVSQVHARLQYVVCATWPLSIVPLIAINEYQFGAGVLTFVALFVGANLLFAALVQIWFIHTGWA